MKPVDVKSNTYIDSNKEIIDKDLKFKIGDIAAPAASANKRGGILALFYDDDDDDDDELYLWYG